MTTLRFSLAMLLWSFTFVALACIALTNANHYWERTVFIAALLSGAVAIIGIVYSQGKRRAFCVGYVVFFWLYLLLSTYKPTQDRVSIKPLFNVLYPYMSREVTYGGPGNPPLAPRNSMEGMDPLLRKGPGGTFTKTVPLKMHFIQVGENVCLIAFGFVGGMIGWWMHTNRNTHRGT